MDMFLLGNQLSIPLAAINEYRSTQISTQLLMNVANNRQPLKSDVDNLAAKVILDTFLEYFKD